MIVFPIAAGYVTSTDHTTAIIMMTLGVGLNGFADSGFLINHLDIAPAFASVLLGVTNTAGTMSGIISPTLTGFIVQHHVRDHKVFFSPSSLLCLSPSFLTSSLDSFLHSFVPSCLREFVPSCLRTFVPSFLHAFVSSCPRTFVPSYFRSCVPALLRSFVPSFVPPFHFLICILYFFHQSAKEWRMVFFINGVIYLVGGTFYVLFASGEKQSWANGNKYEKLNTEESSTDEHEQ